MIQGKMGEVGMQLEALWATGTLTGLSDAQLLGRFAQHRDAAGELAFRELVRRHGPMVLGVCRQVLRHAHDADDAFQATFLVLVRKAPAIGTSGSLGPWLYSVACRTARRARRIASRHRPDGSVEIATIEGEVLPEDFYKLDLRPLLYEELARLPDKYRDPIVLCHLEGKTHEEAARLLRWPVGTVSGRLSRGRQLLRSRLERRGVAVSAGVVAALGLASSRTVVAAPLVESTLTAATRFAAAQSIPASVLTLTQGVLKTMFLRKLSTISCTVLLAGAISGGVWGHMVTTPPGQPSRLDAPASASAKDAEAVPAPSPTPAPRARPRPTTGSAPMLAENCSTDCPVPQSKSTPEDCPIRMAAMALRGMFAQLHGRTTTSP